MKEQIKKVISRPKNNVNKELFVADVWYHASWYVRKDVIEGYQVLRAVCGTNIIVEQVSMTNLRSVYLDIAGYGILLIVFGHNWLVLQDKGELYTILYSFHVPLFFFQGSFLTRTNPCSCS